MHCVILCYVMLYVLPYCFADNVAPIWHDSTCYDSFEHKHVVRAGNSLHLESRQMGWQATPGRYFRWGTHEEIPKWLETPHGVNPNVIVLTQTRRAGSLFITFRIMANEVSSHPDHRFRRVGANDLGQLWTPAFKNTVVSVSSSLYDLYSL